MEAHLTKVNGGHLVRIVGPGFALVRSWEAEGIPLSIVERAIEQKAERHQLGAGGRTGRALRIEFCEADVRALFDDWKRAVGVMADASVADDPAAGASPEASAEPASRKPSLSKHLERVSERLSRLLGRRDLPEPFLECVNQTISAIADARDRARAARGPARDAIAASLAPLDAALIAAARAVPSVAELRALEAQAAAELGAFRQRLGEAEWSRAERATIDRLLRERFALPVIDPEQL